MGQHNSEKDIKNYVHALRRVGCENTESAEKKEGLVALFLYWFRVLTSFYLVCRHPSYLPVKVSQYCRLPLPEQHLPSWLHPCDVQVL